MEAVQIFSDKYVLFSISYCIGYMATLFLGLGPILPLIVFLWSLSFYGLLVGGLENKLNLDHKKNLKLLLQQHSLFYRIAHKD